MANVHVPPFRGLDFSSEGEHPLRLVVQPWGQEYEIAPSAGCRLVLIEPRNPPEIVWFDDRLEIRADQAQDVLFNPPPARLPAGDFAPPHFSALRFENQQQASVFLIVEPWASEYEMLPHTPHLLVAISPDHTPTIICKPPYLIVYVEGANYRLFEDGCEVSGRGLPPDLLEFARAHGWGDLTETDEADQHLRP